MKNIKPFGPSIGKTKLSRKITYGKLKVILKDLGFYDGPISEEDNNIIKQCG